MQSENKHPCVEKRKKNTPCEAHIGFLGSFLRHTSSNNKSNDFNAFSTNSWFYGLLLSRMFKEAWPPLPRRRAPVLPRATSTNSVTNWGWRERSKSPPTPSTLTILASRRGSDNTAPKHCARPPPQASSPPPRSSVFCHDPHVVSAPRHFCFGQTLWGLKKVENRNVVLWEGWKVILLGSYFRSVQLGILAAVSP